MLGANLPWIEYGGDFGANLWHPNGGITAGDGCARLDEALLHLKACGATAIRWFMLCDGRGGIRFDADGAPLGVDEHVFVDLGAKTTVAEPGLKLKIVTIDQIPLAYRSHLVRVN